MRMATASDHKDQDEGDDDLGGEGARWADAGGRTPGALTPSLFQKWSRARFSRSSPGKFWRTSARAGIRRRSNPGRPGLFRATMQAHRFHVAASHPVLTLLRTCSAWRGVAHVIEVVLLNEEMPHVRDVHVGKQRPDVLREADCHRPTPSRFRQTQDLIPQIGHLRRECFGPREASRGRGPSRHLLGRSRHRKTGPGGRPGHQSGRARARTLSAPGAMIFVVRARSAPSAAALPRRAGCARYASAGTS